jgi:CheY-like chemotaxis protein
MTKEVRERAFEPFFTTKPRDKGTGLGLAMIYGFVKQSGGLVRIYSEPGLGTTVNMYLPLVQPTLEPEVIPDELVWSAPPGLTVLVVDDEPDLLTIALAYLAEIGCRGLTATDGATALDILQCEPQIGLIITDIIMPHGMSGVELAKRVHALYPSIKVIYTSGFPAGALQERNMALAEGPLLRKPYQRAEFRAIVRSVVQGATTIPH